MTKKQMPAPAAHRNAAPKAGPNSRAAVDSEEFKAIALGKSRRSSSSVGMSDCIAGAATALNEPSNTPRTRIQPTVIVCVSVRIASSNACNIANTCVTTMRRMRLRRSASTPATGVRTRAGICEANATNPSQ